MASEDWYRNERWGQEIEEDFFAKLKRSRSQKTQYVKIQAGYLIENYPEITLRLLNTLERTVLPTLGNKNFTYTKVRPFTVSLNMKKQFHAHIYLSSGELRSQIIKLKFLTG